MSTDPAHSLSDAFDAEVGPDPKEMSSRVWAQEMDPTSMIEENWAEIQAYISTVFEWQGANTLGAGELALLPGMDELFGLLMVRRHHREGKYDAHPVDAAPTGETLKRLSRGPVRSATCVAGRAPARAGAGDGGADEGGAAGDGEAVPRRRRAHRRAGGP